MGDGADRKAVRGQRAAPSKCRGSERAALKRARGRFIVGTRRIDMGRRSGGRRGSGGGNYKKVTTIGRDVLGRRVVETRYVKVGTGFGGIIALLVLVLIFMRGC